MSERTWQAVVWFNVAAAIFNAAIYEWGGHWYSLPAVAMSLGTVIWYCATWRGE